MKKSAIIAFLLICTMCVSLVACNKDSPSTEESKEPTSITESSATESPESTREELPEPDLSSTENSEESKEQESLFPDPVFDALSVYSWDKLDYKLAVLYDGPMQSFKTKIVMVLEHKNNGFANFYFEAHDKNGNVIENAQVTHYAGGVCLSDDINHGAYNCAVSKHNMMYVIIITSEDAVYKAEDIVLNAMTYNSQDTTVEPIKMDYTVNGTMNDITLQQPYLHQTNLIKLGTHYYLVGAAQTEVSGTNNMQAQIQMFLPLDTEKGPETLDGTFSIVDYKTGNPVTLKSSYQFVTEYVADKYYLPAIVYGVKTIDPNKEIGADFLATMQTAVLEYTYPDGYKTVIFPANMLKED